MMTSINRRLITLASALLYVCVIASNSHAGDPASDTSPNGIAPKFPLKVTVVSPLRPRDTSIQHHSGWPLTFRISSKLDVPLIVPAVPGGSPSAWPELGATSFLMLQDLDGCPAADGRVTGADGTPFCPVVPGDELWVEFTPDEDYPGIEDEYGFSDLRAAMKAVERRSMITYQDRTHTFGPRVSGTFDGLGYGANDDLPGFVLLAEEGIGVVLSDLETRVEDGVTLTEGWEVLEPAVRRNLAGFMTSVGFELNDERQRTTITTSLMVPRHLTERRFLEDQCFEDTPGVCATYRRVEGGPPMPAADANLDNYDVTLKAFMVQGVAPDTIADCDGDGAVGAADAVCMGYRLLSRERQLTFRQIGRPDECNLLRDPWGSSAAAGREFVDFDGNGDLIMISCPGGSTGGGLPPRQRQ
ncbi:MAG: hypothetical protein AAFN07_14645 [Pseudomonadota bacterium]